MGSRVGGSSGKRVDELEEEACLDMIERDRGGGIELVVVLLTLARDEAGRRVAIGIENDKQHSRTRLARRPGQRSTHR